MNAGTTNGTTNGTALSKAKILLVEDNPGDVRLTMEALKEGRILNEISVVEDGMEAIAYLRRAGKYAAATRPDLILLDLNLPRKDGREVLEEIKEDAELKKIPVRSRTSAAPANMQRPRDRISSCSISICRERTAARCWRRSRRTPSSKRSRSSFSQPRRRSATSCERTTCTRTATSRSRSISSSSCASSSRSRISGSPSSSCRRSPLEPGNDQSSAGRGQSRRRAAFARGAGGKRRRALRARPRRAARRGAPAPRRRSFRHRPARSFAARRAGLGYRPQGSRACLSPAHRCPDRNGERRARGRGAAQGRPGLSRQGKGGRQSARAFDPLCDRAQARRGRDPAEPPPVKGAAGNRAGDVDAGPAHGARRAAQKNRFSRPAFRHHRSAV